VSLRDALVSRLVTEVESRIRADRSTEEAYERSLNLEDRLQEALNENAQLRKINDELTDTLRQLTEECQKIAG
jgi:prefoldin subunit 5